MSFSHLGRSAGTRTDSPGAAEQVEPVRIWYSLRAADESGMNSVREATRFFNSLCEKCEKLC
jgi:hypothetical protein